MTMPRYGASKSNMVQINRGSIAELNQAIADLEERGYEVVSRDKDTSKTYRKGFDYKENRSGSYRYSGDEAGFSKCRAVMRRVKPYVQEDSK